MIFCAWAVVACASPTAPPAGRGTKDSAGLRSAWSERSAVWSEVSPTDAMEERVSSAVVWTGSELIVWGGWRVGGEFGTRLGNGARYDPKTDRWAPMSDV